MWGFLSGRGCGESLWLEVLSPAWVSGAALCANQTRSGGIWFVPNAEFPGAQVGGNTPSSDRRFPRAAWWCSPRSGGPLPTDGDGACRSSCGCPRFFLSLRCVSGTHNPRAPPPSVDDGIGRSASREHVAASGWRAEKNTKGGAAARPLRDLLPDEESAQTRVGWGPAGLLGWVVIARCAFPQEAGRSGERAEQDILKPRGFSLRLPRASFRLEGVRGLSTPAAGWLSPGVRRVRSSRGFGWTG